MTQHIFLDKSAPPTAAAVSRALGARAKYLDELKDHVAAPLTEEWKHYGKTIGWNLKLLLGKRNLCFIAIHRGSFAIAFTFGDRAVALVEQSGLPADVVQSLVNAKRYVEGRGIRLEVTSRRVLGYAKQLLDIKRQS